MHWHFLSVAVVNTSLRRASRMRYLLFRSRTRFILHAARVATHIKSNIIYSLEKSSDISRLHLNIQFHLKYTRAQIQLSRHHVISMGNCLYSS